MNSVQFDFPVQADSEPSSTFAGHLYRAQGPRRGVLQVLVHGVTYDHRYWDAGSINGTNYSYAAYMTERGYDVLAIDLPGTGDGTRPSAGSIGFDHIGAALSSAARQVREQVGPDDKIALVGHSLGAYVLVYTQARWPLADFLVSTGTGFSSRLLPSPYGPGAREQALFSQPYPTLTPEIRSRVFYHHPTADPAVINYDNAALRTSIPRRIWKESIDVRDDPALAKVKELTCPILVQLGEFDPVLPSRHATTERGQWPTDTDVIIESVEGAGHSLNLHRNPDRGWRSIDEFLRT